MIEKILKSGLYNKNHQLVDVEYSVYQNTSDVYHCTEKQLKEFIRSIECFGTLSSNADSDLLLLNKALEQTDFDY